MSRDWWAVLIAAVVAALVTLGARGHGADPGDGRRRRRRFMFQPPAGP